MVLFRDFVLFALWTFTVHFSTVTVWTSRTAQTRVIGSPLPIIATLGDDVILPCHLDPPANVEGKTVEWSKPDLKPDLSDRLHQVEYVHVYRNRREDLDMKIQSYVSRTTLFMDELKLGNISLKITNVTLADGGRYRCYIPKLEGPVKDSVVELVVEANSAETTENESLNPGNFQTPEPKNEMKVISRSHLVAVISVVVVSLVLTGAVVGYLVKYKSRKANLPTDDVAPSKPFQIPAEMRAFLKPAANPVEQLV